MPIRSPADATRFTATGPHAFSRTSASAASVHGAAAGGETPQQRVARLRDAAKQAKMDKVTLGDKLYHHGRIWADRAHRAVALGLIGTSIVCGVAVIATFTEMTMHNRKLKREYAEETKRIMALEAEQRKEAERKALIAAGGGPGSEHMTAEEIEKGKGVVANLKSWALKGLTPADQEFRSRFDKEGGNQVVIDGPQDRWLPTKDGRIAERDTEVPEPGKFEKRILEKVGDDTQGRGVTATVLSWFGR